MRRFYRQDEGSIPSGSTNTGVSSKSRTADLYSADEGAVPSTPTMCPASEMAITSGLHPAILRSNRRQGTKYCGKSSSELLGLIRRGDGGGTRYRYHKAC